MLLNAIYTIKSVKIKVHHRAFSSEENRVTSTTEEQDYRYATFLSLLRNFIPEQLEVKEFGSVLKQPEKTE